MFLIMPGKAKSNQQVKEVLYGLCEPYGVAASIGPIMGSIDQCARCADICEALIEIGLSSEKPTTVSNYTDFMLEYLMRYDTHGQPKELLCHPAVRVLNEHDAMHGTAYIRTLQGFLHMNQSPTATARMLYVHRSTLLERLERMRVIMGDCDWKDWKTQLCLNLSLELLNVLS